MDVRITLHGDKEEPSYNADFEVHFLMALVKKKNLDCHFHPKLFSRVDILTIALIVFLSLDAK